MLNARICTKVSKGGIQYLYPIDTTVLYRPFCIHLTKMNDSKILFSGQAKLCADSCFPKSLSLQYVFRNHCHYSTFLETRNSEQGWWNFLLFLLLLKWDYQPPVEQLGKHSQVKTLHSHEFINIQHILLKLFY